MHEPPAELSDGAVLRALRTAWDEEISDVEHLALGFGAHHWRADIAQSPRFFVTYDRINGRHTLASLEQAYEGAAALAESGLGFVVARARTLSGRALLRLGAGALSCTPWHDGEVVGDGAIREVATAEANLTDLARLHTTRPPGLRRWRPLVNADFADVLRGSPPTASPTPAIRSARLTESSSSTGSHSSWHRGNETSVRCSRPDTAGKRALTPRWWSCSTSSGD